MRLGITMRQIENTTYKETRDALSHDWVLYLRSVFPHVVVVPLLNHASVLDTVKQFSLDGIILSGGNDWGQAPERDLVETKIMRYCLKNNIPLLGVCRGLQVVNVLLGGKITTNLKLVSGEDHVNTAHAVTLVAPNFRRLAGKDSLRVNSFHNHGVLLEGLSPHLKVFAVTKAGVVEGVYHEKKRLLAVAWHPERKNPAGLFDKKIIKKFFLSNGI